MKKIISITSGKGGVGKTLTTINLAIAARAQGLSVLVIDGDFGLSNVDVLLGLTASHTLIDVLDGSCSLSDIIMTGPRGINLIPSGSGISRMASLGPLERGCILAELNRLQTDYDIILIDTGAGISPAVLSLNAVSDLMVVVTTPEPHALTDAYATVKVMADEHERGSCSLIMNQIRSEDEGVRIAQRVAEVARQFSGVSVTPVGFVRSDAVLARSVMARRVAWDGALNTLAGQGWASAWRRIYESFNNQRNGQSSQPLSSLWHAFANPGLGVSNP